MEIRSPASRLTVAPGLPWRRRLADIRQTIRHAVDDTYDDQRYLLDDLDLEWLAALPQPLPRGSVLNILV